MVSVLSRNAPVVTTLWPACQAGGYLDGISAGKAVDPHVLRPVGSIGLGDENQILAVSPLHGVFRHDHRVMGLAGLDLRPAELVGTQPAAGVGHFRPHSGRAGCRIDLGPDPGDFAGKRRRFLGGSGSRDGEIHPLPVGDGCNIGFVNVDPQPHGRGVGNRENPRGRLDGFAACCGQGDHRAVDGGGDREDAFGILRAGDTLDLLVAEAEILQPLLGFGEIRLGVVQCRERFEFHPGSDRAGFRERLRPVRCHLGELHGGLRGEIAGLGGADLGGIDHGEQLAPADFLAKVGLHLAEKPAHTRPDFGIAAAVIGGFGVGHERAGEAFPGRGGGLQADVAGHIRSSEPHRCGRGLAR